MPVTLTVDQLALETRVNTDSGVSPREPFNTILQRQLDVNTLTVQKYAEDAPDDVLNEAVVRLAAYWLEVDPSGSRMPRNSFELSGAKALLAPWHELVTATVT